MHRAVRYALLLPVLAVLVPYVFSLVVMWGNPGSSLEQRGIPVLVLVAAGAMLVELAAILMSLYLLATDPAYRTRANAAFTLLGFFPIALFLFFAVVSISGHG